MNVVYLNTRRKFQKIPKVALQESISVSKKPYGAVRFCVDLLAMVLTLVFSPIIIVVCFIQQLRCDHVWLPSGKNNSCAKCYKKELKKDLLGIEKL